MSSKFFIGIQSSRIPGLTQVLLPALAVLACLAGTGCSPKVSLQGLVTNLEGEPLPGVSVKVEAAQAFGVTNGIGIFGTRPNTVAVDPGTWELIYIKTGFTSARQTIEVNDSRVFEVPDIMLWPLPAAKGVYILDGNYYEALTRVSPERFQGLNRAPVFGFKQAPELRLDTPPIQFVSHKMPNYDWALSRIEKVTVFRPGVEVQVEAGEDPPEGLTEAVWSEAVRLPIDAAPIDLPERQLWRIKPAVTLGPGVYALHWGALDGDTTTEESVYLIGINDPEAEVAEEEVAPEEGAPEDESEPEAEEPPAET